MNLSPHHKSRARWIAPLLVLILGAIAFSNSEHGPFILDDIAAVRDNPQIHSLNPFKIPSVNATTISGRPVLIFSFAVNYAMAGRSVEIYHATNLVIHLACALVLYEILRRTLSGSGFSARESIWLAAAVGGMWVVHPLTTQAVTYVAQRAESLASLFLALTILCVILGSAGRWWWGVLAVVFCAAGTLSKEIVVVAPVLALLYDRAFLAGTFSAAIRKRWVIYIALATTWAIIPVLLMSSGQTHMAGFHLGVSARQYAETQMNVMAHYVRLAIWPTNLCLDYYDWPIAKTAADITWRGRMVMLAICGWIAALRYRPRLAFLGAWFFLILAPSSSFLPIKHEAAAEQRMYLPLAAIICGLALGGWILVRRHRGLRAAGALAWTGCVVVLIAVTLQRNDLYQSPIDMWTDTVAKRPNSARARFNLGEAYAQASLQFPRGSAESAGAIQEATDQFREVLELEPEQTDDIFAIGESLDRAGDPLAAERFYTQALAKYPNIRSDVLVERGNLRARREDWTGAREDFLDAIDAKPRDVEPHYFLGVLYIAVGDRADAISELRKAADINPNYKDVTQLLARISSPGSQPVPAPRN